MPDRREVAHLLRRLTFGPTAAEVDAAERAGFETTLRALLVRAPFEDVPDLGASADRKDRKQQREQVTELTRWWLTRMAERNDDKLTFFWHGHWATSVRKVRSAHLMLAQLRTLNRYGAGDTGPLVRAMLRDPALILWLDGQKNTRKAPNENLAREVMELFTLGVGAYTEDDVKAAARVLTGWQVDRDAGTARLVPKRHDDRPVTLLGRTATFDVDSFAGLLVGHPAHVPFLVTRLWARFAATTPPSAEAAARIAAAGRDTTALLGALCREPEFAATAGHLVKQPVEWLVGAARQLGVPVKEAMLRPLGQVPLRPPSVGGWPSGAAWLTTSSALARLDAGRKLAAAAPAAVEKISAGDRLGALADLLVIDAWSNRTHTALRDIKDPRLLLALGLASPEYAVH